MVSHIGISKEKIAEFCNRNHICRLCLFGSVLREDFAADSDVDVLVDFEGQYRPGLMELVGIESELSDVFGRKVDMVERQAVERSENYIRRKHTLESLEAVYVA